MTQETVLTVLGFFLTLIGLLGSYFSVHLSTWYADVVSLRSKWQLNRVGESEARKEGRLECRYELSRVYNHIPALVFFVTLGFMGYLAWTAFSISGKTGTSAVVEIHLHALAVFIGLYVLLSIYFLLRGYSAAREIKQEIEG